MKKRARNMMCLFSSLEVQTPVHSAHRKESDTKV